MEAIVQTGGLQYPVKKGQILDVNQIDAKEGTEIELDVLVMNQSLERRSLKAPRLKQKF